VHHGVGEAPARRLSLVRQVDLPEWGGVQPRFDVETAYLTPFTLWTNGRVVFQFMPSERRPQRPFDEEPERRELQRLLNGIPGVQIPDTRIALRPSFPLSVLDDEAAMLRFFPGFENDQLMTFIESKSLTVYPMLLAQFVGIALEIKPAFVRAGAALAVTCGTPISTRRW
jgi:hypothetical protein